jgi:NADH-quinone oxidoreductase subunit I
MVGLGVLKALRTTLRHFFESYRYDRSPFEARYSQARADLRQRVDHQGFFTIEYPEQRRRIAETFRFLPMLLYEETPDEPRCVACGVCARVCPPQCIWIERATDDRGRPKPQPAGFWVDASICMSCGFCAEFCPFDAIKMNQNHEFAACDRDRGLFFDLEALLTPVEAYARLRPSETRREEEARQARGTMA